MHNNQKKFTYGAQKSGPKGYPVNILSAMLFFKGEKAGLPVPSGPSDGKWGDGISNHPHVERTLPDRLAVTFYSFAENQAYQGIFDLPYEKLVELFQWGVDNPKVMGNMSFPIFSRFVVGVAPGGTVAVWITGHGEQREVLFGQAEKLDMSLTSVFQVPFSNKAEAESFRIELLKKKMGEEQLNNIAKNGIPFDIWQRYRKPFQWIVEVKNNLPLKDLYVSHVNGEIFNTETDIPKVNNASIPSFIGFSFASELYEIKLDDYETIVAFEALDAIDDLSPEEKLIHIEVTPRLPTATSSIRIYNAKKSITLKKAAFVPY
jgi:hypothetical protein